ncbi:hypothetical protein [Telmatospirillum sp. J64-1]|uniref:hypothetical protein n=1 Tax=Telmatospirillum sp. J64-1 TaxID=2502183 RepID=UPI00163DB998|nr:hypothetical protein [Telmatospirillum sp. J64-1]
MRKPPPNHVANFDSAAAFLRSTAHFLQGKDFPALGLWPGLKAFTPLVNMMPLTPRQIFYTVGGWGESLLQRNIDKLQSEDLARWAVSMYPRKPVPAVFIGSSNGALTHLCAALRAPWLPQTLFVPVSQIGGHPDDFQRGLDLGIEAGRRLLENNPDLQLHHMHDPNQDRLMLSMMTYFRVKRRKLGAAYEDYLRSVLPPGGTIVLVECGQRWPVIQLGERHYFQPGAVGGASPEEFLRGGERVEDFLARYNSPYETWTSPEPTGEAPEAEWGFEESLREDVERFARRHGYRILRVSYPEAEDFSPFVADLYAWWYRQRNIQSSRLVVESFVLHEPWWVLRTGAVPYWCVFNTETSVRALDGFLDERNFDHIHMMLFSNGIEAVGQVPIERWRETLDRARREGSFLGVDTREYPADFASFSRYHLAMKDLPPRYPMPGPLTLEQLADFVAQSEGRYKTQWHGLVETYGGARQRSYRLAAG